MTKQIASVALLAGLGLAVSVGGSAQAAASPESCPESTGAAQPGYESKGAAEPGAAQPGTETTGAEQPGAEQPGAVEGGQARLADMTGQLENAYDQQFEQGNIDQAALARLIAAAVQAFPPAARGRVKIHIDEVFETGKNLASQMTPEQRRGAITPPKKEQLGRTQQAQLVGWGWGTPVGFGGLGAFGFPGMYGWGNGVGFYGTGLGLGGWYW